MASTVKIYLNEIYQSLGYRATWEPKLPIELGAYGKIKAGLFQRYGHLSDLTDQHIDNRQSRGSGSFKHTSEKGVNVTLKLAGEASGGSSALGEADAGLIVEFTREKAVAFQASGTINYTISNLDQLKDTIFALYQQKEWEKDFVLITEVIAADSTTVLISRSKNSRIELKAAGKVNPAQIDLATAEAEFVVAFSNNVSTQIISAEALTPMYKARRLKRNLLGKPQNELKALETQESTLDDYLEEEPVTDAEFTSDDLQD